MQILKSIKNELIVAGTIVRYNLASAMELRTAFAMQVFGMCLNNIAFITVWIFFFKTFGEINDWSYKETIGLQGFAALTYGITYSAGNGARKLPEYVSNGMFDNLILSPRNLYFRIITSSMNISAVGDVLYGSVLLTIFCVFSSVSIMQILLLLVLIPSGVILLVNFTMFGALVSFLFPDSTDVARNITEVFFGPSLYPSNLFDGLVRFTFLFIIPGLVIGGFPIEVVRDSAYEGLALAWGLAVLWTVIVVLLLNRAVRNYESGNMMGIR